MSNTVPIRSVWPYQQKSRDAGGSGFVRTIHERDIGIRAATLFPVRMHEGPHQARCRALELSASGMVIERGRELSERERLSLLRLDLLLPGEPQAVRALARVVRPLADTTYALKFVFISDVERLTLMEHLDRQQRESLHLLHEIEAVA